MSALTRHSNGLIPLKPGEHAVIFGRNGSGKTVYVKELIKSLHLKYPKAAIVIINQKADESFDGVIEPCYRNLRFKTGMLYNWYVPSDTPEIKSAELIEHFLMDAWDKAKKKKQEIFIIADEGQALNARSYILQTAWTQGRSKRFSVITLAQRPVWLSKFCISQSAYLVIYNIAGMDDLKAIDDYMESSIKGYIQPEIVKRDGGTIKGRKLPRYNFLVYGVIEAELSKHEPIELTTDKLFIEPKPKFNKLLLAPLLLFGYLLT